MSDDPWGLGQDLHCRETADQKARRYVDNLQSLMSNAFGITLKVYYEAEWAQRPNEEQCR
jgi:hypothetical protein